MKASLSELRKNTAKVVRPVIRAGRKVTLTDHGLECAKIIPLPKVDRKAALEALRAIGPVDLPRRK